jgi:hypothetical protein
LRLQELIPVLTLCFGEVPMRTARASAIALSMLEWEPV